VIVNGTIVVKNSKVLDVRPGQPIRFLVEPTGRFQPVEVHKWLGTHAINVPDMHEMDDTGAAVVHKH
jgi:N-acyl-D-amino-acid deacylase